MPDEPVLAELNVRRPNQDTIRHLEKLLEQARSGELTGLAYVAIWHGYSVNSSWVTVPFTHLRTVVGELHFLTNRLIAADDD